MIKYSFLPTDQRLSRYIFSYGIMELQEGIISPLISPPNGMTGFLIRIKSDKNGFLDGKDSFGNTIANQPSYAIGQMTHPISGYGHGQLTMLVVFFKPMGMFELFKYDTAAITNKSIDLIEFLGPDIGLPFLEDLTLDDDIDRQIAILNTFFLSLLPNHATCSALGQVLQLIHDAKGNITVKTIEQNTGIARRTIERQFSQKIGISPKVYAQIIRFKNVLNYLESNPGTTWAELTHNNGFFDQAHMIRYFKKYLNISPNNLVKLDLEFINYLIKEN